MIANATRSNFDIEQEFERHEQEHKDLVTICLSQYISDALLLNHIKTFVGETTLDPVNLVRIHLEYD